ncbi:hypothetical protein Drorol1_Dr00019764 [Drosera rotundifolia]
MDFSFELVLLPPSSPVWASRALFGPWAVQGVEEFKGWSWAMLKKAGPLNAREWKTKGVWALGIRGVCCWAHSMLGPQELKRRVMGPREEKEKKSKLPHRLTKANQTPPQSGQPPSSTRNPNHHTKSPNHNQNHRPVPPFIFPVDEPPFPSQAIAILCISLKCAAVDWRSRGSLLLGWRSHLKSRRRRVGETKAVESGQVRRGDKESEAVGTWAWRS